MQMANDPKHRPTNKWQLKVAALKAWQIKPEKNWTSVLYKVPRLQAVIECNGFSFKY